LINHYDYNELIIDHNDNHMTMGYGITIVNFKLKTQRETINII